MNNPYTVLGVRKNASAATIKKAFRRLATEWHPDRHPGDPAALERSKEISAAYEILSDPARRKRYDETGECRVVPSADHDVAGVIVPVMFEILQQYAAGAAGNVADADLIARIRGRVRDIRSNVAGNLDGIKRGIAVLNEVAGRLSVRDGEDYLGGAIRSQLAACEGERARAAAELDKLDRAILYLAKCRYRQDLSGPTATACTVRGSGTVWLTMGGLT